MMLKKVRKVPFIQIRNRVYSGPRPFLHLSFVELCSVVFV